MKKIALAAVAVLGLLLGAANLVTPAQAYSFAAPTMNNDGGG